MYAFSTSIGGIYIMDKLSLWLWLKYNVYNIRTRMVIILTMAITLIITSTGIVSYYGSRNTMQREISEPQDHLLRIDKYTVDKLLQEIDLVSIKIAFNSLAVEFLNTPRDVLNFNNVSILSQFMDAMVSTNIESIYLYDVGKQRVLATSPHGFNSSLQTFADRNWILPSLGEMQTKTKVIKQRIVEPSGKKVLTLYRSIQINQETAGIVAVNMDWDNFISYIFQDQISTFERTRMIFDENGKLLFEMNPLSSSVEVFGLTDTSKGFREIEAADQKYLLSVVRSDFSGWTFASLVSVDKLMTNLKQVQHAIQTITAISILIGCFGIMYFNFIAFRPIKRIKRLISQYNVGAAEVDLPYLEQFTSKMLKEYSSLSHMADKNKTELRKRFIEDMLFDRTNSREIRHNWNLFFEGWTDWPALAVIFSIDRYPLWSQGFSESDQFLL
jgi:hypothetical protein